MRPAKILTVPLDPRLHAAIFRAAARQKRPANELVAETMARELDCPQFGAVPRKAAGRPRENGAERGRIG